MIAESYIWSRYRDLIGLPQDCAPVSLGEANTPLLQLHNQPELDAKNIRLFVKFEGNNPTGSFKDRGMCVAVAQARHQGARAVLCASTGNTSASAAAYAARAGMRAFVIIPEGKIAFGKLAQASISGACVVQISGNFDAGMQIVKKLAEDLPITLVNSVNPWRLAGQKSAAFEVVDSLGQAPDYHCLPVGNAGNISAHGMGYKQYLELKRIKKLPMIVGYQASGSAAFVRGEPIINPETIATAIRIGNPQSWDLGWKTVRDSNGWFADCDDATMLAAQKLLVSSEGIFCEPSSAVSVAGALADIRSGRIKANSTVVCTLTGHGLKDPDTAVAQTRDSAHMLKSVPDYEQIKSSISNYLDK